MLYNIKYTPWLTEYSWENVQFESSQTLDSNFEVIGNAG